jgi:predicted AlkP superfamily pyrophosphatase or phosphodiesterase
VIFAAFRNLPALIAAALLVACAASPVPAPVAKPGLVVLVVFDGVPQRQLTGYRDQLAPDGLRRFLDRGGWFSDAHYGHAFTVTAAGHAAILTGAYPHRAGIIGNDWLDPATGELTSCAGDPSASYIGHKTNRLDGTSPRNLRAQTVGDVLRAADARSKVIAISGKDRGAILLAGKAGTAYMYMAQTGQFASSTFYMKEHPAWVTAWNAAKPADRYFRALWKPLLDDAAYARSLPDGQAWYAKGGALPKTMGEGQDSPGPLFYGELMASPFGDALTLDFARAAIAGERLGAGDATDILAVSLSSHDYVNHAWSAESRLSHDHLLQLDRLFEAFLRDLDRTVGKDNYVAVLTADHGFMPAPEHSKSLGRDAGRLNASQAIARLNAGLAKRFGEGQWAFGFSAASVAFNKALVREKGFDPNTLAEEARTLLLAEPGIAVAYTRAQLESGSAAGEPLFTAMQNAWHRDVSGDAQVALKPYWMVGSSTLVTTHGSPYPYDTHVPILFYGPKWIAPGRIDTRVEVVDIAPTLARMLGVAPPAASEGKPLPLRAPGS